MAEAPPGQADPSGTGRTSLRDLLRAAAALFALSFRAAPGRFLVGFLLEPLGAVLSVLGGLWLKLLVNAATGHDRHGALVATAALIASFAVARAMSAAGIHLRIGLQERIAFALEERLARIIAAVPGLEPFERPDLLDQLDLLRQQRDYYWYSLNALIQGLREVIRLAATVTLLASVSPALLFLPALGLPTLVAGIAARRSSERAAETTVEDGRLAGHLLQCATTRGPAREVRLFGLAEELEQRWEAAAGRVDGAVTRAEGRAALGQAAAWLVFALGYVGAVTLIALRAVNGQATAGDVLLIVTVAGGVAGNVRSVATWTSEVVELLQFLARYVAVTRFAETLAPSAGALPAPDRLASGITFEGVSFRYPGTDDWVLRDVQLHLPAGATVALVGENGAGKTTLVKLLGRFYAPTEGRVLVDDADLARLDVADWRRRLSAGFQDFARLELLARETVGVGDLPRLDDAAAVTAALERAGAADVIGQLVQGLEAPLGTSWGGTELSVGQWQKLALGRALLRERPLLLLLDEPTASLDAQTEHALFERYASASRRLGEAIGAITVLVSHRFSTVRMADLIVVLEAGRVIEQGSHEELLGRGGLYAELFAVQAQAYR